MEFRNWSLLKPLRGPYRAWKRWTAQLLHPLRRDLARRRLTSLSPVHRVLVLCLGNVCRSPYGATRLTNLDAGRSSLEVKSAGLMGFGNPCPTTACRTAHQRGLDLEGHVSQLVSQASLRWADLVVVMEPYQGALLRKRFGASRRRILILGDLDPHSPSTRHIPDPLDQDDAFFMETYARMDRCLEELATVIRGSA